MWNETVDFLVYTRTPQVQLWLFDWDAISGDDFMGEASFHARDLSPQESKDGMWLSVRQRSMRPDDFNLYVLGRIKVSWSLERIKMPGEGYRVTK